jgi:hypothetical protein
MMPGIASSGHCLVPRWCCLPPIYASVGALVMTRDDENAHFFSYDTGWESRQLVDSRETNFDFASGIDIRIGRQWCCGLRAVEFVYWGVYPRDSAAPFPEAGSTVATRWDVYGQLNGILNWDDVSYNGSTGDWSVNNAVAHGAFRESEFHNVEVNLLQLLGGPMVDACGTGVSGSVCCPPRWRHRWLAGLRFFKFRDELVFGADTVDGVFTGAPEEIYYHLQTENYLYGIQLGHLTTLCVTQRLGLDLGIRFGLFQNRIEHEQMIGGTAGIAYINNGPHYGQLFYIESEKNDVAGMGQLDLGVSYNLTPRWTVSVGYRIVAVSGVALPTAQIYPDIRGTNDGVLVDSNGSLLLHGGYFGLGYDY